MTDATNDTFIVTICFFDQKIVFLYVDDCGTRKFACRFILPLANVVRRIIRLRVVDSIYILTVKIKIVDYRFNIC